MSKSLSVSQSTTAPSSEFDFNGEMKDSDIFFGNFIGLLSMTAVINLWFRKGQIAFDLIVLCTTLSLAIMFLVRGEIRKIVLKRKFIQFCGVHPRTLTDDPIKS